MSNPINLKLKLLICEADSEVLKRLESWVEIMGQEVFTAEDAMEATEIFNEVQPDIVLVSENLNSMDSIDFIEDIKKKVPSQTVILMLDSEAQNTIFKRAIDINVDKYLNMPVDETKLLSLLGILSKDKGYHNEFASQKSMLQDYKNAIDKSFSVSKHNRDGEIFYVNDSFCKTTKLSYEDAMKGIINPLINPNADMKPVWNDLHNRKIYRDRQIFKFEDKQDHIVDITAVTITNESNEIDEYLVFSNDVTDVINAARKIKQQEIDKKLQKLEHEKELIKMKDSFLTVFSHELRTPLNSIINFSEYVKKHLQKEEFKKRDVLVEQVAQINMSGWHMLNMVSNLIDSIKLRDSELELVKSEFLLESSVNNVLNKYKDDLKNIKVIKSFKNNCMIISDKQRIEQILDNLISNAIKYSNNTLAVIIESNDESFVLEVLDNGDGFAQADKVFDLFVQSDEDDMTRTAQGTGVGLFVVKKLCDMMLYTIDIKRSQNLGGARVVIKGKKEY